MNDFSNISAESELKDLITMSPMEQDEAIPFADDTDCGGEPVV